MVNSGLARGGLIILSARAQRGSARERALSPQLPLWGSSVQPLVENVTKQHQQLGVDELTVVDAAGTQFTFTF
jgi:hypothetical protein